MTWTTAAAIGLAYLVGSLPTGLWLGLALRGVDIREHGSKNIGATNTMRVLGKGLGSVALLGDMAKGAVSVLAIGRLSVMEPEPWLAAHLPLLCGLAAILGHSFSVFLKFRGGKGVATSAGVFLALAPVATLVAAAAFGIVVGLTRMVSAGSLTAAVVLTALMFVMPHSVALRTVTCLVAAFVIVKHRTNIQRILAGNENRI